MLNTHSFYERGEGNAPAQPLTVKSVMSRPTLTLRPGDLVRDAMELMRARRVRHVPIVEEDGGLLVGVVTETDLFREILHGRNLTPEESYHANLDTLLPVGRVMVRDPVTLPPDAPIAKAVELFLRHRFRCVPVVDGSRRLLGIVTETDLMRLLGHLVED